jgi:hypothetical protein
MCLLCTTRLVSPRLRLLAFFALGTLLFFAYRSHFRLWRARVDDRSSSINGGSSTETGSDPGALIVEADHFYWLNNGPRAAPLYAKAEQLFSARGDTRNAIHAKVGHLRSEAETISFVDLSGYLEQELHNPIVERDRALQLWCLVAKGYTTSRVTGSTMYRASRSFSASSHADENKFATSRA